VKKVSQRWVKIDRVQSNSQENNFRERLTQKGNLRKNKFVLKPETKVKVA
jgi:hypothetical protein